jgi:deazaflavin-dependent oxidoreductase (nitroreductase family)
VRRYLEPPFFIKRIANPVLMVFGVAPTLVTYGRNSGRTHRVPVNVLSIDGIDYLVASYGVTDWSRNLLANPEAELRQGRKSRPIRAFPVSDAEKPPLIVAYRKKRGGRPGVRRQFEEIPDPKDHPVFRIEVSA